MSEFRWIKVKIIDDTPGDELWIEELKEVDVDLEEMKADIALEIRVGVNHSDECFETYGRLPCICAVERAARIVEAWSPSEKEEE